MAKRKEDEPPKGAPAWQSTFADLMNLLLCFFVLLFSMSTIDAQKWEEIVASFNNTFSVFDGGASAIGDGVLISNGVSQLNELSEYINSTGQAEDVEEPDSQTLYEQMEKEGLQESEQMAEQIEEALAEMQKEVDIAMQQCTKAAEALSRKRKTAAVKIEKEMQQFLIPLGIPNVQFKVALENCSFNNDGSDKVAFLFSANRSSTPQPVSQVASGGEIARVMLSLKAMISGAVKLPTIIFDEIDTGVSGKIAEKMAQIMQQMGYNDRQVISITHLPQIASKGKIHYKVFKEETADGTISRKQTLNEEERIREIAQMLSGSDISEAAINNAKELLKQ